MSYNNLIFRSLSLFALFLPLTALSQSDSLISTINSDTVKLKESKHSLFISVGYGGNMIYLGSTISQNQPYGYGALIYGLGNKLYITASAVHLSEKSPFAAFYAGTISYNHVFSSWFDISTGISRYQVASSLEDTLFNSFFYGDIIMGVDWRILYTKISTGILVSDGARAFFQFRNSRYFETPEFTAKKFTFSFDPNLNLIAGPIIKSEATTGSTVTLTPPFKKGWNRNHGSSTTKYTTTYGIMELDFGIPVDFNASRFTIEAEPSYVLPLYKDAETPGLKGFNFQITLYFKLL